MHFAMQPLILYRFCCGQYNICHWIYMMMRYTRQGCSNGVEAIRSGHKFTHAMTAQSHPVVSSMSVQTNKKTRIFITAAHSLQCLPSGYRSCCNENLMSVCTLKQNSGGTSSGFTNIKSNRNMSRFDWKCSPVYRYWLNQSKSSFPT